MSEIDPSRLVLFLQIIGVAVFFVFHYEVAKALSYAWHYRDHEKWECYTEVFKQEGFQSDWSGLSREVILLWMKEFKREWSDSAHAWVPIDPNKKPSLSTRFMDYLLSKD